MSTTSAAGAAWHSLVDVGENRKARRLEAAENAQSFREARPAIAVQAGAIGFIEGGFEDERESARQRFADRFAPCGERALRSR